MQKNIKIILIDDDQDICDLLTMELTATGRFLVTASTRSDTAIALIKEELPELVILDINMPEMHGVELATILAQDPQTATIPILYLSGMVSPEEVDRIGGGDHAATALISKQSPLPELIAAIDGALHPEAPVRSCLA